MKILSLLSRARTIPVCAIPVVAAVAGCSYDPPQEDREPSERSDIRQSPDEDSGPIDEPQTDTDDGPDEDASSSEDAGSEEAQVRRFIVMGDTGEGNEDQKKVAEGARERCREAGGCHGMLMLGDNIYDTGPESAQDEQFRTKVDEPYRELKYGKPFAQGGKKDRKRLPIYVSLGNHDLGGLGLESELVDYYLEYAEQHDWFYYPEEYWEKKVGPVHLMSLHTNPLAYEGRLTEEHGAMVDRVLEETDAEWTVVFGHHPYRSNGAHGNAGEYENIPGDLTFFGGEYRDWLNEHVCDRVDFLFTAHDHNRQWIRQMPELTGEALGNGEGDSPCETHLSVSGAGAKTRDMKDRGNDLAFGEPSLGFMFVEFYPDKVNVEFCDSDGVVEWTKTIRK